MDARRVGLTLLEAMVVIIVAAVLIAAALPRVNQARDSSAVVNARNAYILMGARARASAAERGVLVRLVLDPAEARAWIVDAGLDTIQALAFDDEFGTEITTANGDSIRVCYLPRGFAAEACNTDGLPLAVTFTRGQAAVQATVRPLGQIERS